MGKKIHLLLIIMIFATSCAKLTKIFNNNTGYNYTNHLTDENSPYLVQHAHNPVNWYPWGDAALKKSNSDDKLIIISIGYSSCHWCHVMENESFSDTIVANYMNENFISIKVDREERPDIDDIYMTSCHLASGESCGWPLNAIALPDGRPIWAGTYYNKKDWLEILKYFIRTREEDPDKIEEFAAKLTKGVKLEDELEVIKSEVSFKLENVKESFEAFNKSIDYEKGGRKAGVKFPMANNWMFALEYFYMTGDQRARNAAELTMNKMANGGIYDHIGGGFSRYSTDIDWKVPHFEKMLYDNAQLVSLYTAGYQVSRDDLYKDVVYETLDFVINEMTSPEGGFYSSYDADSEGEEGKYYTWTYNEVALELDNEQYFKVFRDYFNINRDGNWVNKKNILHVTKSKEELAKQYSTTPEKIAEIINICKAKLSKARAYRVKPGLDDKVLTSWNALMLKAFSDAYRVFGEERFKDAALKNARFLQKKAIGKNYKLTRNYKDGRSKINGFLDDYAFLIDGFISLYQATFDEKWLNEAKGLQEYSIKHFHEEPSGLFFYTSDEDAPLITRKKELSDNVMPSSNSVMAKNLERLGAYYFEEIFLDMSKNMMRVMANDVLESQQPYFYSNWLSHYMLLSQPPFEVAIVGANYESIKAQMDRVFLPNVLLLGGLNEGSLLLLEDKLVEGETIIYVCKDKMCKAPVITVQEAISQMKD